MIALTFIRQGEGERAIGFMLNMALHITWFTPINGFTPIMILHTVRDGKAADDPILRIENISKTMARCRPCAA